MNRCRILSRDGILLREYFESKLSRSRVAFYNDIRKTRPIVTAMAWTGRHVLELKYAEIAVALNLNNPAAASAEVRRAAAFTGKLKVYRDNIAINLPAA